MVKEPKKTATKAVVCAWPNVWTSVGKLVEGDKAKLPAKEAEDLIRKGAVK